MVDHTGVGIEVSVTMDAVGKAVRKNAAVEGGRYDLRVAGIIDHHLRGGKLLLAISLVAHWAARVAVERFVSFDLCRQDVSMPFEKFAHHIGVHHF